MLVNSSATNITDLLARASLFRSLPAEVTAALAEIALAVHYPAGSVIFLEDDPVAGLYVVESGTVRICRISKDGREHVLAVMVSGDSFNDVAAMDGGPNPATAIAQTDANVWRIRREDLQAIARRHPALAWNMLESIARRTRHLIRVVQDLSMRSVRGRLAHLLLEQAQANTADGTSRMLTQEEMASRLGTVREMVGRGLRGLAADGIIAFDRHRIVILNLERLADEAEA